MSLDRQNSEIEIPSKAPSWVPGMKVPASLANHRRSLADNKINDPNQAGADQGTNYQMATTQEYLTNPGSAAG
jgi:hypothetical protein